MARNTKPRIIRTPLKRAKTTDPFPVLPNSGGVGLGALEKMWHTPAAQIRQWVLDGLLAQQSNGLFSTSEINRFNREHGNLLP
ncbi:hypothetical protein GCM10009821_27580 [Aeromicrobium halocynthiae]|uniref:Uncharacterized protein n=1 Tax=Aeromicrobium halocynthiae TaxID=560557 RepID=A0ABN2W610_9ACTN